MAIGIWLVGARGSLGTTVAAGVSALQFHAINTWGLVTELDEFSEVDLADMSEIVIGGHDFTNVSMRKKAEELAESGVFSPLLLKIIGESFDQIDSRVCDGVDISNENPRQAIDRVVSDLVHFKKSHSLDSVIVVNVSSTEPQIVLDETYININALDSALENATFHDELLPASSVYAYAAIASGFPFIDFTPSTGASIPALVELALANGVALGGRDGKTGETLLKTALAPMFLSRNLRIDSWAGMNILGGGDGKSLSEPDRMQSKLQSKAHSLEGILSYSPEHPVHIDYLPDMGQWKTAWNHIAFQGFMGTQMRMQFTWEGCDSALAAPLIIDLARLIDLARRRKISGYVSELGFFFKDPIGSSEHRLAQQFETLVDWANGGAAE